MFFLEEEEIVEDETPKTDIEPVNAELDPLPDPKVPFPVPKEPFPDPKVKGLMVVAEEADPVADMLLLPRPPAPPPVAVTVDVFGAVAVVAEILPFRLGDPGARVEVGVMSIGECCIQRRVSLIYLSRDKTQMHQQQHTFCRRSLEGQ